MLAIIEVLFDALRLMTFQPMRKGSNQPACTMATTTNADAETPHAYRLFLTPAPHPRSAGGRRNRDQTSRL